MWIKDIIRYITKDYARDENNSESCVLSSPSLNSLSSTQLPLSNETDYYLKNPPESISLSLDSLSSSQPTEPDYTDYHLKSSIPSNVTFLVGSMLYLKMSRMDLVDAAYYYDNDYDYGDDYDYYYYDTHFNKYAVMSLTGSLMFIANAIWDMYWCYGREKEWKKQIELGYESDNEEVNEAYHKEEMRSFSAALAFGTAGSIDLGATFIKNADIVANITIVTTHIYLLSAILALRGTSFSCPSIPAGLTLTGDLLFAIGSVIDVIISYLSDPEISHFNDLTLAQWWSFSSILWFVDACLYFLSDMTIIWYRGSCCSGRKARASDDKRYVYTLQTSD